MIEATPPLALDLWATAPAPDHVLLEQVATLRLENAARHAENANLQRRVRELDRPIILDDLLRDELVTAGYADLSTRPELQAAHQKALEMTAKYGSEPTGHPPT